MWQRWNQTTHIFEKSVDNGVNWTPLGLSGDIITEGVLALARVPSMDKAHLPASVAYEDEANTFTENQLISRSSPELALKRADVASAKQRVAAYFSSHLYLTANASFNGAWNLDDTAIGGAALSVETGAYAQVLQSFSAGANPRTGSIIQLISKTGQIYERGRSVALGEWASYTPTVSNTAGGFSLGNATIVGKYTRVGLTVHFHIAFIVGTTTNMGGAGAINFSLPVTPTNTGVDTFAMRILDSGTGWFWMQAQEYSSGQLSGVYAGQWLTPTNPMTWVAGDALYCSGTYEG